MSPTLFSWLLALLILTVAAWSAGQIFRTTDGRGKLLRSAVSNIVTIFLLAHAVTLQWASTVPIWLWWATAVLLAVYLGGLTYRLLSWNRPTRDPARVLGPDPTPAPAPDRFPAAG